MSDYTRINPKPTLDVVVDTVTGGNVTIASGSWGDSSATIPAKAGYTPIGVLRVYPGSPANLTLIGFETSGVVAGSSRVIARMRNMSSSSGTWNASFTIAYAKVS